MKYLVIAIVVVLAAMRPFMAAHALSAQGSYEAFAHMVVGGLIGAWLVNRARWLLWTWISFSVVELVCFIGSKL